LRQAQTPQQRRANLKFAKEQEARMGKSEEQLKKRNKTVPKSPISPVWVGTNILPPRQSRVMGSLLTVPIPALLGFAVIGGLIFEVISRIFLR
jgi:hypothetical protein